MHSRSQIAQVIVAVLLVAMVVWGLIWAGSHEPTKDGSVSFTYQLHLQAYQTARWTGWPTVLVIASAILVPLIATLLIPCLLRKIYSGFTEWFLLVVEVISLLLGFAITNALTSILLPAVVVDISFLYAVIGVFCVILSVSLINAGILS